MKKMMMFVALFTILLCGSQQAQAGNYGYPLDGPLGGAVYAGYGRAGLYTTGQVPVPPYFALHPPVYYSYPVPRPYGYSPYAYPGTVKTPNYKAPSKAVSITNPYVDRSKKKEKGSLKTASHQKVSQVIINPYVNPVALVD